MNKKPKKNIFLPSYKYRDVNNFTSDIGMNIRKAINPYFIGMAKKVLNKKIIIENYPHLEKNKPYIFASTHSFNDDALTALLTIDRNAYLLLGSIQQLDYNPDMYPLWVNGMIFVDVLNKESRNQTFEKMKRVLKNGNSMLIFPEGSWNVTENKPVNRLFRGVYNIAKEMDVEVVPIGSYREYGKEEIYINYGNPISTKEKGEQEFLEELRDEMATRRFNQINNYSTMLKRSELGKDPRRDYLEERREEVLVGLPWVKDTWEEEYKTLDVSKIYPTEEDVWSFVDNIELTPKNAQDFAKIKVKRMNEKKYNLINFLHQTWDKKDTKDYWEK